MALASDGEVYTWGNNTYGQLGDISNSRKSWPVRLRGFKGGGYMSNITGIASGGYHGMVLRSDGAVFGWGHNGYGQLGNGNTTSLNYPDKVKASNDAASSDGTYLTAISLLSAGLYHSVALTAQSKVLGWGINTSYELGQGTTDTGARLTPLTVRTDTGSELTGIVAISAGGSHTLALDGNASDGGNTVYAWGRNTNGELGLGTVGDHRNAATATTFTGGSYAGRFDNFTSTAYDISAGFSHSAVLGGDGFVYSFGRNDLGGLGNGNHVQSPVPVRSGVREDSLLISNQTQTAGVDHTDTTRVVLEKDAVGGSYALDTSRITLREYGGDRKSVV